MVCRLHVDLHCRSKAVKKEVHQAEQEFRSANFSLTKAVPK